MAIRWASLELDPANAADNVRSMNNTAATMAAFRSSAVTLPAAPTGLTATAVAYNQINLSWVDNASNESNYTVERSINGSTWSEIATLSANTVSFSSTGLSASTTYYFRVRASNSAGYSGYSTASATTPSVQTTPPAAPSNLFANAISSSQINLTWTDQSSNEDGFRIERSTDGANFGLVTTVGANVTSYADTGRNAGTTYYYRVQAYNAGGNSGYVAASTTTQAVVAPPAAPSNLSASTVSPSQLGLTWTQNSSNENGFYLERSLNGSSWLQYKTLGPDVTGFTDSNLSHGTTYYYRIRAFNAAGMSLYSNVASARTKGH